MARAALDIIGGAQVIVTKGRGHEKRCARDALAAGATHIAVLGGDGTISQVACELVRLKSAVPLAIFAAGTGNDFAKSVGAPVHDYVATTRLMAAGQTRRIDAGQIDDCVFVNSAGFGFDAEVVARTRDVMRWRGKIVYIKASLEQLFRFRGFDARVVPPNEQGRFRQEISSKNRALNNTQAIVATQTGELTGTTSGNAAPAAPDFNGQRWLTMVFANGGWFGGSFRIAPHALLDDGLLDAVYIGDASPRRRVAIFARALSGRHITAPEVR
ncbi:MAG: hypothetical protein M3Y64_03305, partial [Gemmatimonadota bacterium]|nr:hypothetical protein [Gemmatimonadota bacterium]